MGLLDIALKAGRAPLAFLRTPGVDPREAPSMDMHLVASAPLPNHPDWSETWSVGHVRKDIYFGHVGRKAAGGWEWDSGFGKRGLSRSREQALGELILAADRF